jgi:hypothetical protein
MRFHPYLRDHTDTYHHAYVWYRSFDPASGKVLEYKHDIP